MVVCRRRRLQDRQRLQTSTLATHSYDHPDVPTPQSVRWRLQLPACQLGFQHNIPGRREPGLLGNIQQPFCDFLNSCMRQLKIPKIWRRALVVAIPKPEKPLGDPKSYRPVSLLCVPFQILERLIYARVKTIIDPLLPHEQAGFRHGKSTVDQVTLLTQDI